MQDLPDAVYEDLRAVAYCRHLRRSSYRTRNQRTTYDTSFVINNDANTRRGAIDHYQGSVGILEWC